MTESVERRIKRFYEREGWMPDSTGVMTDTRKWGRTLSEHIELMNGIDFSLLEPFHEGGEIFINCGCGPFTSSARRYSEGFMRRFCLDLSVQALRLCRDKFGDNGLYVCGSAVKLPVSDNISDGTLCEHVLYHIDQKNQEQAVRELIRVTKCGKPIVIIYSNPLSPLNLIESIYSWTRLNKLHGGGRLYVSRMRLSWWQRFRNSCDVEIRPYDPISAHQARILLFHSAICRLFFRCCGWLAANYPKLASHLWNYPVIILRKRS